MPVPSLFAIIVVYKQPPENCRSLLSLLQAHQKFSEQRLAILVADNTPGGQIPGTLPEGVRYHAYPHNPGLAQPYNDALTIAAQEGFQWFLTLDQDTELPPSFLSGMAVHMCRYSADARVAAVVPKVTDNNRLISPFRFIGGAFPVVFGHARTGLLPAHASAINSASIFRTAILAELGGYDVQFPLHHSDTRLFLRLDTAGKRVVLAGDVTVSHELAILDRRNRMSLDRYRKTLRDECAFWDKHMGLAGRSERLIRLVGRVIKGWLRRENPAFLKLTSAEIARRLGTRRRTRLTIAND